MGLLDDCARNQYKKDGGWKAVRWGSADNLKLEGGTFLEGSPTNYAVQMPDGTIWVVEIGGYEYDVEAWKKQDTH